MAANFKFQLTQTSFERYTKSTSCFRIKYLSEGLKIDGFIIFPKKTTLKKLPVVIFNRGGNRDFSRLTRLRAFEYLMPLAEKGFLVLASNYRGSQFSEGKDEMGGGDVNDVVNLINIAKELPLADKNNIAMWGWSRGATMTFSAARNRADLKALIVTAGAYDKELLIKNRPAMEKHVYSQLVPDYEKNKKEALYQRSPIHWLDDIDAKIPVLILHGTRDFKVSVEQSKNLANKLKQLNHPHKLVLYPDGHGLAFHRKDFLDEILAWLVKPEQYVVN